MVGKSGRFSLACCAVRRCGVRARPVLHGGGDGGEVFGHVAPVHAGSVLTGPFGGIAGLQLCSDRGFAFVETLGPAAPPRRASARRRRARFLPQGRAASSCARSTGTCSRLQEGATIEMARTAHSSDALQTREGRAAGRCARRCVRPPGRARASGPRGSHSARSRDRRPRARGRDAAPRQGARPRSPGCRPADRNSWPAESAARTALQARDRRLRSAAWPSPSGRATGRVHRSAPT